MSSITKFLGLTRPVNNDDALILTIRAVLRAVKHKDMTVEAGAKELVDALSERESRRQSAVELAVNELQAELLFWKTARVS